MIPGDASIGKGEGGYSERCDVTSEFKQCISLKTWYVLSAFYILRGAGI